MTDQELLEEITRRVASRPQLLSKILVATTQGLEAYEEYHKLKRDAIACEAAHMLMALNKRKSIPASDVLYMIPPAFYQFPKGPASHSAVELHFWGMFLDAAADFPFDTEWLGNVRGQECLDWWNNIVLPAVEARKAEKGETP